MASPYPVARIQRQRSPHDISRHVLARAGTGTPWCGGDSSRHEAAISLWWDSSVCRLRSEIPGGGRIPKLKEASLRFSFPRPSPHLALNPPEERTEQERSVI
jgi:hypothetical protein